MAKVSQQTATKVLTICNDEKMELVMRVEILKTLIASSKIEETRVINLAKELKQQIMKNEWNKS